MSEEFQPAGSMYGIDFWATSWDITGLLSVPSGNKTATFVAVLSGEYI